MFVPYRQERTLSLYSGGVPPTTDKSPAKRSEARERLLSTASDLFYSEGINGVGVDRIVSASNVTLATFYRHFPSKQDLVVSYLQAIHDALVPRSAPKSSPRSGTRGFAAVPSSTPPRSSKTPRTPCARLLPNTAAGTSSGCGAPSQTPGTDARATPRDIS